MVKMFSQDFFSQKTGPLLFQHLYNVSNNLQKHELIILIIHNRPRNWEKHVKKYIESVSIDTFYLGDVLDILQIQYRYSFASFDELKKIRSLIKTVCAKHHFGVKKPTLDKIAKISDQVIPTRVVDK